MAENDQKAIAYDGVIDVEAEQDFLKDDNEKIEQEILREFNADGAEQEWIVTVKKIDARTKKQQTCFKMSPDEISSLFDRLKDEYGPGEYRAYVTCNGVLKRNLGYSIAAPKARPIETSRNEISQLADLMRTQNEQIMNFVTRGNPNAQQTDPMAMFTAMMGAISTMKDVFAPQQPQTGFKDSMELFRSAFDMAQSMNDGGGNKNIYDIIEAVVQSPLADQLGAQIGAQQKVALPPPSKTQAPPVQLSVQENAPDQHTENELQEEAPQTLSGLPPEAAAQLQGQISMWLNRAKNGSDPALFADLALDTYDPMILGMIVNRPDLKEIAIHFEPEAAQYWYWFQSLISEIQEGLTQDMVNGDNGNSETEIQPGVATPDAPAQRPDETGSAAPANADGNSERRSGDTRNVEDNAKASSRGKEKPARASKDAGANAKAKTKRPAGGSKRAS